MREGINDFLVRRVGASGDVRSPLWCIVCCSGWLGAYVAVCAVRFGGKIDGVSNCQFEFQNEKPGRGRKTKPPRLSTIDRTREESEAITKVVFDRWFCFVSVFFYCFV